MSVDSMLLAQEIKKCFYQLPDITTSDTEADKVNRAKIYKARLKVAMACVFAQNGINPITNEK